jgi:4-hydroxy-3-polyprenylbenzoate decarboxylase
VLAAYGEEIRELVSEVPDCLKILYNFEKARLIMPGVVALKGATFTTYANAEKEFEQLDDQLKNNISSLQQVPLIIVCDDPDFVSANLRNFLWVSFTRSNPSHDMHGIGAFHENKHWGCTGSLIFDARVKPHHAPVLEIDPGAKKRTDHLFEKGGSLYGVL